VPAAPPKRRLPVLREPAEDDDTPVRPAWQWVGFGALGIFVVWLPSAWLASLVALRVGGTGASPALQGLVFAASLVLSSLAGGYLVGRWGTRGVGVRHAALSGLTAGVVAAAMGTVGLAMGLRFLVVLVAVAVAAPPAALGGRLGLRKRSGAW
jgi:hypothetical protein